MLRAFALAFAAALLLAGCSKSDDEPEPLPSPPPPEPDPLPPPPTPGSVVVRPGDTWRYVGGTPDAVERTVVTVLSLDNDTIRMRSVTTAHDNATHRVENTITRDTLALVSMFDDRLGVEIGFSPPFPVVIPAEDHEHRGNLSVPTSFGTFAQPVTAHVRFLGMENVTVPAGDFVTYRYNVTLDSEGAMPFHQETEMWFSPVVRQAVRTIVDGWERSLGSYELTEA